MTEDERCAEARRILRIDDALRQGDLEELRAAVQDVLSCLVNAIYLSPLAFIRTLLELGADPKAPADDGFPPLIAALSCLSDVPGSAPRTDVHDILRLLLSFGADPDQRGINDYTALHMAVAQRDALAVQILLDGGADPDLRTRIDECETPLAMAEAAGETIIAAILARRGAPLAQRLRPGLTVLLDVPGAGQPVRRQRNYTIRLRLWLKKGDPVRWMDGVETRVMNVRIHRGSLINGLFYGIEGMRVGGTRRLSIAPHLAYGDQGIPGVIPPAALLTAEISILEECRVSR